MADQCILGGGGGGGQAYHFGKKVNVNARQNKFEVHIYQFA